MAAVDKSWQETIPDTEPEPDPEPVAAVDKSWQETIPDTSQEPEPERAAVVAEPSRKRRRPRSPTRPAAGTRAGLRHLDDGALAREHLARQWISRRRPTGNV